jgi:hypothetical protein
MARSLGWKVRMRRAQGYREGMKSIRRCVYRKQLDLDTLVCTRGPNFPLSRLESRLMCPACGSRDVTVVFEPPTNRQVGSM